MIKWDPQFLIFRGDIGDIQGHILQSQMGKNCSSGDIEEDERMQLLLVIFQ